MMDKGPEDDGLPDDRDAMQAEGKGLDESESLPPLNKSAKKVAKDKVETERNEDFINQNLDYIANRLGRRRDPTSPYVSVTPVTRVLGPSSKRSVKRALGLGDDKETTNGKVAPKRQKK